MNKKLFLPLALTLMLSSFSSAKDFTLQFCSSKNDNTFSLTLNSFEQKLSFVSSQFPEKVLMMTDFKSKSLPANGGIFTYSGITQTNIKTAVSYTGVSSLEGTTQTIYVFTYENSGIGLGWEDAKSATFLGKSSWCNK